MSASARRSAPRLLIVLMAAACVYGLVPVAAVPQGNGNTCRVSATPLTFGIYHVSDTQALDSTAQVHISCGSNNSRSARITLSNGIHGSYALRRMSNAVNQAFLDYQVYTDQTHVVPWGNGAAGTSTVTGTFRGAAAFTMFGRLPPLQSVPAGQYTDQLIVTVSF